MRYIAFSPVLTLSLQLCLRHAGCREIRKIPAYMLIGLTLRGILNYVTVSRPD